MCSRDSIMEELEALVGLEDVKEHIRRITNCAKFEQTLAAKRSVTRTRLEPRSMHLAFVGNPGTGKTTVARLVGPIYRELGLLRSGHVIEIDTPATFIAGYVGQTAERTNDVVDQALDGVLVIDEVYQLADETRGGFGQEALHTIMTRMENHRDRLAVIFAGCPGPMDSFLGTHCLSRRIAVTIRFPDYSQQELRAILKGFVGDSGLRIDEAALDVASASLEEEKVASPARFGNAWSARRLFEHMRCRMSTRLSDHSTSFDGMDLTLKAEDIPR